MPDEIPAVGTVAPAVPVVAAPVVATPAPVAVASPAPVAPAVQPPVPDNTNPAWLPGRLEQAARTERDRLFTELGVANVEDAKAAVAAAKAAADAKKSAEERLAETTAALAATKTTAERHAAHVKEISGRMLMALAPEQQKAVTDFAGDDPEKQYQAIKHFGPTWAAAEQAKEAAAAALVAAAAVPAVAATTSPAPAAPSSETPTSPADPKSVYDTARATNPFRAAAYGLSNPAVYDSK